METSKVFGPPGTGKTTYLLNRVEESLAEGVQPHLIGFFSFTNKAADEARFRAVRKFPKYNPQEFRYFRTLHSLALETIGGAASFTTMSKEDWDYLGKALGLTFTASKKELWDETLNWDGITSGDKVRSLCDLARLRGVSIKEAWRRSDVEGVTLPEIERFQKSLTIYKKSRGMIDFCDMLEMSCNSKILPTYKLLIIDEAQDLSSLQWNLVERLVELAEVAFIAGDDDQAIFQWAGADVERFISFPGKDVVLDQSYRVPLTVSKLAEKLQKGIKGRVEKVWNPRPEIGNVKKHYEFDPKNLGMDEGEWLILVRNNYQLKPLVDICIEQGYWFTCKMSAIRDQCVPAVVAWENLRKGEKVLISEAKVVYDFIGTGRSLRHGAKADLKKAEGDTIDLTELTANYGLNTADVWYEALNKLTPVEVTYLKSCRRNNEKLKKDPRIKLSTIHGAKGGEADNVVLFTDYSRATDANSVRFPADEHRVWYVGATRARVSLHIIMPQTNSYFKPICH
jgi:DNA helicase-2/ATP-dependent DNA helicase PcrA